MSERYFVINRYRGKGGHIRHSVGECATHEDATRLAAIAVSALGDVSGDLNGETFEVFIGSRTKLDEMLRASRAPTPRLPQQRELRGWTSAQLAQAARLDYKSPPKVRSRRERTRVQPSGAG
jgi:hypothetical protein